MNRLPCFIVIAALLIARLDVLAQEEADHSAIAVEQAELDEDLSDDEDQASEIEERRIDEAALIEDPEAQRRARALAAEISPEAQLPDAGATDSAASMELYGSARVHVISVYDIQTDTQSTKVSDGNSRVGIRGDWEFQPGWYLLARGELGFNVLDNFVTRGNPVNDKDFEARLAYAGIDNEKITLVAGRNWSAYYKIAGTTDRFAIFGGSASGVYNAGTAGQATGTGRAEEVVQARLYVRPGKKLFRNLKPFNLNLQYQRGQPIPFVVNERYDYGYAASAFLETTSEFGIGIAFNRAVVPVDRMAIQDAGIDGDATALAFTTRAYGNRWYAALLVSRLENVEITDQGRYFNGTGVEFYSQWEFKDKWWLIGGANLLEPDSEDTDAGLYRVRYAVIGGRYSFDSFRRMIYLEYRLDDGRLVDGRRLKDELTIGIRWDFGE